MPLATLLDAVGEAWASGVWLKRLCQVPMLRFIGIRGLRSLGASRSLCSGVPVKEPPVVGLAAGPDARDVSGCSERVGRSTLQRSVIGMNLPLGVSCI